jgi:hypothetical protein
MVTAGIWLPIRPKFDLFACRCAAKTANEARLKVLNLCAGGVSNSSTRKEAARDPSPTWKTGRSA